MVSLVLLVVVERRVVVKVVETGVVLVLDSFRWRVVVETVAMGAVVMVVVKLGVVAATVVVTVVVVVVGGGAGGGGDGVPRLGRPGKDSWCH